MNIILDIRYNAIWILDTIISLFDYSLGILLILVEHYDKGLAWTLFFIYLFFCVVFFISCTHFLVFALLMLNSVVYC